MVRSARRQRRFRRPHPPTTYSKEQTIGMDVAGLLPVDVLADVLRRLAPRSLAASRCVCKAWRAIIDARRLLRADLLPLSLDGIFIGLQDTYIPMFFSRRSTGRKVGRKFDYLDTHYTFDWTIMDHCNGLLLLYEHVVNPATRQWVRLPPRPPSCLETEWTCSCLTDDYLAFDPTMSPHYEVFLVPYVPPELPLGHIANHEYKDKSVPAMRQSEWPPSPYIMHVFSSETGRWKERSFIREGEAAGTIADMESAWDSGGTYKLQYPAYWRGALYVHCEHDFIVRITLSNEKYQVIKLPKGKGDFPAPRLGKSEKGVYCAFLYDLCAFQIWFLDESRGHMEWVLKGDINLKPVLANFPWNYDDGPWIVQKDGNNEAPVEENFEWESDNDNVRGTEDSVERHCYGGIEFLGFHPYKEIIVFLVSNGRVIAYHLNSSKVQDLGAFPCYDIDMVNRSFLYTPCLTGELSGNN